VGLLAFVHRLSGLRLPRPAARVLHRTLLPLRRSDVAFEVSAAPCLFVIAVNSCCKMYELWSKNKQEN
jgi:hypothetical protein